MNLKEYIEKRNGVPIGHSDSLRNNLYRALGANNFTAFWNNWNPIFGYYLGYRIFKPLKNYFIAPLALVFTLVFCGFLHDVVTTVLRGEISFFFTIWFLIMAIAVLITQYFKHDFKEKLWIIRALVNVCIIGVCLALSIFFNILFFR
jgi:hypothetical protein